VHKKLFHLVATARLEEKIKGFVELYWRISFDENAILSRYKKVSIES
jgi:molybdopterin biosynthesis enzyme MoaB